MSLNPISQQPYKCLVAPRDFTGAHIPQPTSGTCVFVYGFREVMNMNHSKMKKKTQREIVKKKKQHSNNEHLE